VAITQGRGGWSWKVDAGPIALRRQGTREEEIFKPGITVFRGGCIGGSRPYSDRGSVGPEAAAFRELECAMA